MRATLPNLPPRRRLACQSRDHQPGLATGRTFFPPTAETAMSENDEHIETAPTDERRRARLAQIEAEQAHGARGYLSGTAARYLGYSSPPSGALAQSGVGCAGSDFTLPTRSSMWTKAEGTSVVER